MEAVELCRVDGCRLLSEHSGQHDKYPTSAWSFFENRDKNKLSKAGFATPRGGAKGGYQNHVVRSNKVIVPYERLDEAKRPLYENDWVVRLLPDQYFEAPGIPYDEFTVAGATIVVGQNAFVLYRSHTSIGDFPPLANWDVRSLVREGEPARKRSYDVEDVGHYLVRLSNEGPDRPACNAGPPQGIFAPEYANEETNFLCRCVLAWLTILSDGSPYTTMQAGHLRAILSKAGLAKWPEYEFRGVIRSNRAACPLCLRILHHEELHSTVSYEDEVGLGNAPSQVQGATRSTEVNLFHLIPLVYGELQHSPSSVAWGHAHCNTRLGQRRCYSLAELQSMQLKVGILLEGGLETIGWISEDYKMIRSAQGAVWIQLSDDMSPEEPEGIQPDHDEESQ